jgi:hypothetical protein
MKCESPITYHLKDMANVKVFVMASVKVLKRRSKFKVKVRI